MTKHKIKKVHALALGSGYVETASWGTVIIVHKKGFNTVQEALESIYNLTFAYCKQESDAQVFNNERLRKFAADHSFKHEDMAVLKPECMIEDTWNEIIGGSLQDHGYMWDFLANAGWDACSAWVDQQITKYGLCWIEKAPEMINESVTWKDQKVVGWVLLPDGTHESPNSLYYAQSHIHHIPKGVKKFRSEVE